jgi:hypothetical protein
MMAPRGGRLPPTRDAVALYAGGPLASLVLGSLFMALHFGLDLDDVKRSTIAAGTHSLGDKVLGDATLMVGVLSLAIAVATTIPNVLGGFLSDGAAIRTLLEGGPKTERLLAMNALMGQLFEGTRPRDWSTEFVRRAACLQDGSAVEGGAASFGLLHALDQADLTAARQHLTRMHVASENGPDFGKGDLRMADAWLAVADGRISEARAAFEQTEGAVVEEFSRCRVLAAILGRGGGGRGDGGGTRGPRADEEREYPLPRCGRHGTGVARAARRRASAGGAHPEGSRWLKPAVDRRMSSLRPSLGARLGRIESSITSCVQSRRSSDRAGDLVGPQRAGSRRVKHFGVISAYCTSRLCTAD